MIEVLVERLDVDWLANYRRQLGDRFQQDQILMRSVTCRVL